MFLKIFESEFLKRKMYSNLFTLYKLMNKKETRDSILSVLYKEDRKKFEEIIEKEMNDCEKGEIYFKLSDFDKSFFYLKKCKDKKFKNIKILSEIQYYLARNDVFKGESMVKNINISEFRGYERYIGEIFYKLRNFKMCDSLLKNREDFYSLLLRAKSNIFLNKIERADSLISKAILRYPDNDTVYKALFIYFLIKMEEKENISLIIKLDERLEKGEDLGSEIEKLGDKWKKFFILKKKIQEGEFVEIEEEFINKNLIASVYFEGYEMSLKKGDKEKAIKFLDYIIKNFKDTPYFIIAQRRKINL